jgi:hypothetical protein
MCTFLIKSDRNDKNEGNLILYINCTNKCIYQVSAGYAVAQLVEALCYKLEVSRVRFLMVSLEFFIDILLAALWPWG